MINSKEEEEVYKYSTSTLWIMFKELYRQDLIEEETYRKVKDGINLFVPIHYILEGWFKRYPQRRNVKIKGYGTTSINKWMDEIEVREEIMRKEIINNIEEHEQRS